MCKNEFMGKIFVTGGSGFIGKELLKKISKSNVITDSNESERIDLLNKEEIMKIDSVDTVIHLAGKTPQKGLEDIEYFKNNLIGIINILEYCIKKKIKKLIYVSSYVYGNPEYTPIDEEHPIRPHNAYTESKFLGERICEFFSKNSELSVIILRPFNIFGEFMKEGYLITNLVNSAKSNKKLKIINKNSKRDFLHVDDFVDVIIKTLNYNCKFEIFNVGSGTSLSFIDIIKKIENFTHKKLNIEYIEDNQQLIPIIESNITKIKNQIKWEPKTKFDEGLLKMLKQ